MSKKLVSLFLAVLMLSVCLPALADSADITVTDMHGREITLAEPATRVVALQPSDCEILCALGCEDALVGVGQYCDYPASIMSLPVVQSGADTDIEEILVLEPQLVLMNDMAQSVEQVQQLEENGVHVVVSKAADIEGVYYAIRMIGHLMGKDDNAEAVVADMQATFEEIKEKAAGEGKTVYFEVAPLQLGCVWTAGKGTFMDELAGICGLTNAFADLDGWQAVSAEDVLARDPDYIVTITMYYGEGPTPVEEILGRGTWSEMKAVKNEQVFNAESNAISRPGPRLKDAAIELFNFINGIEAEEVPAA